MTEPGLDSRYENQPVTHCEIVNCRCRTRHPFGHCKHRPVLSRQARAPDGSFSGALTRKNMPHQVQKFVGDEWVRMSDWPDKLDEEKLQRHARALGGSVRLTRGELLLREWRNGMEIEL